MLRLAFARRDTQQTALLPPIARRVKKEPINPPPETERARLAQETRRPPEQGRPLLRIAIPANRGITAPALAAIAVRDITVRADRHGPNVRLIRQPPVKTRRRPAIASVKTDTP